MISGQNTSHTVAWLCYTERMDKLVVASVQMHVRLPATVDEFRDDVRRFAKVAEAKRARLVIFPELAGTMLAPAMLRDLRTNLLRQAEQGKRKRANAWQRMRGGAAGWLASVLKADLRSSTGALLDVDAQRLWDTYCEIFSSLAREYHVTLVAPSAYLPEQGTRVVPEVDESEEKPARAILNQSAVFGEDGALLGTQSKVLGSSEDEDLVQRGRTFDVIQTNVGRLGIMLGSDVLYPEVGRLLAYQDAEVLVLQAACPTPAYYNKTRAGILARMQDNQLFAVSSYLTGENPLRKGAAQATQPYQGRSAVFAPQELPPRFNGVLVEMGSTQADGVVTAEWDFNALRQAWEGSETPLRKNRAGDNVHTLLAALYTQLRALPQPPEADLLALPDDGESDEAIAQFDSDEELFMLDQLPVVASVTSTWPLRRVTLIEPKPEADGDAGDEDEASEDEPLAVAPPVEEISWSPRDYNDAPGGAPIRRDDETDEMDAVEEKSEM